METQRKRIWRGKTEERKETNARSSPCAASQFDLRRKGKRHKNKDRKEEKLCEWMIERAAVKA